jgi:hypothetical protein
MFLNCLCSLRFRVYKFLGMWRNMVFIETFDYIILGVQRRYCVQKPKCLRGMLEFLLMSFWSHSMLTWHSVFFYKNRREKSSCSFSLLKTGYHVSIEEHQNDIRMNSNISQCLLELMVYVTITSVSHGLTVILTMCIYVLGHSLLAS